MHTFKNANFDRNFTRVDDFKESLIFLRRTEGHCKKFKGNCRKPPCNTVPAPSSSLPKSSGFASHKPNRTNLASDRAVLRGKSDSQHKKKVRRGPEEKEN